MKPTRLSVKTSSTNRKLTIKQKQSRLLATNHHKKILKQTSTILANIKYSPYFIHLNNQNLQEITIIIKKSKVIFKTTQNEDMISLHNQNINFIKINLLQSFQIKNVINNANENQQPFIFYYRNQQQFLKNQKYHPHFQIINIPSNLLLNNHKYTRILQNKSISTHKNENKNSLTKRSRIISLRSKINSTQKYKQKNKQSLYTEQPLKILNSKRNIDTSDTDRSTKKPLQIRKIIYNQIRNNQKLQQQQQQTLKIENKKKLKFYQANSLTHDYIQSKRQKFQSQFIRKRNNMKITPIQPLKTQESLEQVSEVINKQSYLDQSDYLQTMNENHADNRDPNQSGTLCESVYQ